MTMSTQFPLSSDECQLLLAFESVTSLPELATKVGRDHSVVARALRQIADRYPVVEKKSGKWKLTDMGRALNEETRLALDAQMGILSAQKMLRIGTNREFASRVLGVDYLNFQKLFPKIQLSVNSYQEGTEAALLRAHIDIGIDCERPNDPDIAYKLVVDEEIVSIASPSFLKTHKKTKDYRKLPHLLCERLSPDKIFLTSENRTDVVAKFNDIATTRAACVQGAGWALLPTYAVALEIEQGLLKRIEAESLGRAKYGVWWLRGRTYLKDPVEKVISWLKKQNL